MNEKLFFLINNIAGQYGALDGFFIFVTRIFVPVILIISIVWFMVVLPKRAKNAIDKLNTYKDLFLFLFSLTLTYIIVQLIKISISFPRPAQILDGVHQLSQYGNYDSFPSMHSALAFAVAMFIYRFSKGTGFILFLLAALVGLSRIFVGVHFPVDVLAGAFIGIFVSWGIIKVFKGYTI